MIILTEVNRNNTYVLSNSKCFNLLNKYRNFILNHHDCEEYNKIKDYYIRYSYDIILYCIEYFNYSENKHREDGPSYIYYDDNSRIESKNYYLNSKEYSYEDYILEIKKLV